MEKQGQESKDSQVGWSIPTRQKVLSKNELDGWIQAYFVCKGLMCTMTLTTASWPLLGTKVSQRVILKW